uniref:Secreted protein n=1 Tax=Anopheles farauti TaxID=69004 RepID=A0A182QCY9_9DIPT
MLKKTYVIVWAFVASAAGVEQPSQVDAPDALDFSYGQLWRYAQQQCSTKGITPTEFTHSWLAVRRCLKNTLDVVQLNEDSMRLDVGNQRDILSRHCPKLFEAVKCFDPFMDMVKGCVSAESYEIFQALRSWFEDILNYLCEDNGANIVYDKEKHDSCTREINRHIITCAAENLIATPELNRKALSEESCSALATAKDCLLGKLKECDVFANGARLFYENFIQITSCKNFIPKTDRK